jgi:cellulose synthase operon protein C
MIPRLLQKYGFGARAAIVVAIALQAASCGSPDGGADSYYESGMKLLAAHDYQKAAIEFRNALDVKGDFLAAWQGLAQADESARDWEGLIQALDGALSLDPKDEATRLKLARFLIVGGAVEQGLKVLNAAPDSNSQDAKLLAAKAVAHYKLKDPQSAIREAHEALKIEPDSPDALIVLAADRVANNDTNGALQILSVESPGRKPDLETQLFKLQIFEHLQDFGRLEATLKTIAALYPQSVQFRKQLVNLYMLQNRPKDAEDELRSIVNANPTDQQAVLDLAQFLLNLKGVAAARDELAARIKTGGDVFPLQVALAKLDYNDGETAESFELLNQLGNAASPQESATAKITLAELNLLQHNEEAANKIIAEVLSSDSRNIDALKLRASLHIDHNEFEPAISDLREALGDQSRLMELMLLLATAYERSGAVDLADKEYADALRASDFNADLALTYVGFLNRHSEESRASDVLTEMATRQPTNVEILSAMAEMKLNRQDWVGAEQIAEKIKHLGSSDSAAEQILATALTGENRYDAAAAIFQNALLAGSSGGQPLTALVAALVNAHRTDKAVALLESTLKENPGSALALVLLGDIELSENAPKDAEQRFLAAIDKQPKDDIGYRALSYLYVRQNKTDAALNVLRNGIGKVPNSLGLHLNLASTLDLVGDYEAAIAEYEYLIKQQPRSLIIANNLAGLLIDHRSDKASLDRAGQLTSTFRNSQVAQFKDTLGWVYYREGDFTAAAPLLEASAANLSSLAVVHYHLGMNYIALGQRGKADEQLRLALAQTPDADLESKIRSAMKGSIAQ